MITIDKLREYGADVDDGLTRCMNREDFYIMLVGKALEDSKLTQLEQQLKEKNLDAAFETAHALKGMFTNLSLTPLATPIIEMTELLRSRTDTDYTNLLEEAKTQFEKLRAL
ncbi:MAG: Hpt domain-containing protein [Clostridia bacterium]|nr:Hpt domain-containing protein [Clostridia bacterium]